MSSTSLQIAVNACNAERQIVTDASPPAKLIFSVTANSSCAAYPTDYLFPKMVFIALIDAHLDLIYPTAPIMHRPTFLRRLQQEDLLHDGIFTALVTAICGSVVAIIPRRFEECQKMEEPLQFGTRTEMLEACCQSIISSRSPDYFDEPDIQKWTVANMVKWHTAVLATTIG